MIYYAIRHKATGELMPQMKRGRGYSWWNPNRKDTITLPITGSPRILHSRKTAIKCIQNWFNYQNGKNYYRSDYETGYVETNLDFKPDSRKINDIEVVELNIEVGKVVYDPQVKS